jgi:hypothetical protein
MEEQDHMASRKALSARAIAFRTGLVLSAVLWLLVAAIPPTASGAIPDPSTIIFDSNRTGNYEIFSFIRSSSQTTQMTSNIFYDSYFPRLSPDRSKILFVRNKKGDHNRGLLSDPIWQNSIWSMNSDGSNAKAIVCTPLSQLAPGDTCANTYPVLYLEHPWWSPDSSRFVLTAGIGGGQPESVPGKLYILNADGSSPVQVYDSGPISQFDGAWGLDASFNPPVQAIYHLRCPSSPCQREQLEIYSAPVTANASPVRRDARAVLTSPPAGTFRWPRHFAPAPRADGHEFLYSEASGLPCTNSGGMGIIKATDGNIATSIVYDDNHQGVPVYSRSSSEVFFHRAVCGQTTTFGIYTVSAAGGGTPTLLIPKSSDTYNDEYPSP